MLPLAAGEEGAAPSWPRGQPAPPSCMGPPIAMLMPVLAHACHLTSASQTGDGHDLTDVETKV